MVLPAFQNGTYQTNAFLTGYDQTGSIRQENYHLVCW
jgi:hypothetical protein